LLVDFGDLSPVMASPETELTEDCQVVNQCATVDRSEEED